MAGLKKVSVILPTYNRANYLIESLESLFAQTYPNLEILVVNDGSTDGTKERLAGFSGRILYFEKSNGGKSSAINLGLRYCTGDYIWVFDDDDIALPDMVEGHVAVFETDPEIGFVHSGYTCFEGEDTGRVTRTVAPVQYPKEKMLSKLLMENFIGGGTVIARRRCYDCVGCFDERLIRSQDYDMWVRLVRAGFRAGVVERPTVKVRLHGGQRGTARDRFDASEQHERFRRYHRIIVQKVYWEVPLDALLPDQAETFEEPRRLLIALLHRAWMVANTMLIEETVRDLHLVQDHLARHPGLALSENQRGFLSALRTYALDKEHPEMAAISESLLRPSA
jgi:glycosyltransferase involved in cell wall biosynthesis